MITLYLATVMGWYLVIISFFLLLRNDKIGSIIADVMAQRGLFFFAAIITVIIGLLIVVSHNIWIMGWPVVITLLGWLILVSGLIRLFCPDTAAEISNAFINHPMRVNVTAIILLAIGLFLLFHAYHLHF